MIASDEKQLGVGPAGLGIFFVPDELVGERQSAPTIFDRPRYPGPAALELLALPAKVELAHSRAIGWPDLAGRSEEHTSELQSLMRISYAVFCLKKKKQDYNQND